MAKIKGIHQTLNEHLSDYFTQHPDLNKISDLYTHVMEVTERTLLSKTLKETHQNVSQAAKILGINRNTLMNKIKKFSL